MRAPLNTTRKVFLHHNQSFQDFEKAKFRKRTVAWKRHTIGMLERRVNSRAN